MRFPCFSLCSGCLELSPKLYPFALHILHPDPRLIQAEVDGILHPVRQRVPVSVCRPASNVFFNCCIALNSIIYYNNKLGIVCILQEVTESEKHSVPVPWTRVQVGGNRMKHRKEKTKRILALLLCAVLLAGLLPAGALAEGEACAHENTYTAAENAVYASCTQDGSHEEVTYCAVCGVELNRTTVTDYAVGHILGQAVTENEVPATCTQDGSYEEVTYCTICGTELSRVPVTDYAVGHMAGETVTENEVPATCMQDGSHEQVTYCTVCGAELSRVLVTDYAVGHIPGQAVTENEVPATCTQDGNHEEVTCCTVCGAELSRVPVTDPKLEMTVTAELEENELQQDELQQDELQKSPAAAQETEEQQKKAAEPQEPDALEATTEEEAESAAKRLGGTRGGTDLVYTVTLSPGAIGGIPIVYRSDEGTIAELPDFWQFYYEPDGTMGFTLDFRPEYCPFTPPDEIHFAGWKDVQTGKEAFEFNRLSALETTFTALWTGTLADLGPIEGIPPVTGETICMNGKAWQVIGRSPEYRLLISSGVLGRDDWWKGAVTYCDGVVFPSFTSAEKEAMLAVTKYEDTDYGIYGKESLNGEKMFLLSAAETDWYFPTDAARDIDHPWWTRSGDGNKAGCVDADGQLGNIDCDENAGLRPAFVLQNSSVLFTSDNVSAKSTPYAGGGSFGILNAGSNVVKPTLLDSSRFGFTANAGEGDVAAVAPGGSLSILYSGAVDYVSAMLTVSNKTYYASIVPDSAAGVWTMTLPGDLVPGRSYVLKVFSEQQNIADYADYASPMREITLNVITSDLLYALPVGESVPLSEIMTALNLYGEVAAVEVSNENLFSASVENGNWIVTSRQSFDAPQWMKVTINGITYEITVTNAGGITTWTALQNELNQGGTVTLTGNLTAGTDDGALTVPEGANVTLDLAGFTLDRGLWFSIARENGSVIINHGTMTITDSSSRKTGRITGGNTLGNGGGISNDGTLTLAGGSIRGNVSSENAGGVWNGGTMNMSGGKIENNTAGENAGGVWNGGTMNMTGGEITSNTADAGNGGGVWNKGTMNMSGGSITFNISEGRGGLFISGDAVMNVSGSPVITDNTRVKTGGSESSNLFLDGNALIGVTGKLSSANICISRSAGFGIFTSGYGAHNAQDDPAEYFHPNSPDYVIKPESNEV